MRSGSGRKSSEMTGRGSLQMEPKKKKPKHGVASPPLCIVSNWHIQETQIRLKLVISCECFKEVKIRKKIIGKHSSPPTVILHRSPPKIKSRLSEGGCTSMLLAAGKKAKQKHWSLHACTSRKMSKGGVWPPSSAPLTYFPGSVPPSHFITLQKLHDAFITFC